MIATALRWVSVAASALVLLGFAFFAVDQVREGSERQQRRVQELADPAPSARTEAERERRNGDFRELVDDANDVLLKPFADITNSTDAWVQRLVPTVIALLVYGLALSLLAGYLPKRRTG